MKWISLIFICKIFGFLTFFIFKDKSFPLINDELVLSDISNNITYFNIKGDIFNDTGLCAINIYIGNYVEDMFDLDLRKKYTNPGRSMNISETRA